MYSTDHNVKRDLLCTVQSIVTSDQVTPSFAGKLTQDQIKAGYTALKKIDKCIRKGDFGRTLIEGCDEFYTRIPHNFGYVGKKETKVHTLVIWA